MLSQVGVSECMLKNQQWANQKVPEGTITPYDVIKLLRIRNVNSPPLPHSPTLYLSLNHLTISLTTTPNTHRIVNLTLQHCSPLPKRIKDITF